MTIYWHNAALQRVFIGLSVNSEFGHRIYLTGIGPEVTQEELRAFIYKYTEKTPDLVQRVDLNTRLPAYMIGFSGLIDGEIQKFAERVNGMYWHGHIVVAHVM